MASTFVTQQGWHLPMNEWSPEPEQPCRGAVVIVHGLGEHAGRYLRVAQKLCNWGFWVRAYDQCGHGKSSDAKGTLSSDTRMLDDLADVVADTRRRLGPGLPLLLLGHSMGGVVVMRHAALRPETVQAIVLSSPALDPGLSLWQKMLVAVLSRVLPNLPVSNGLDARYLSHELCVVEAYQKDPLVHRLISARLARFLVDCAKASMALAAQWHMPTLLMYSGDDHLVDANGSHRFARAAPADTVTAACFGHMYHEILNETDADKVFSTLKTWLDQRFQP